MNDRTTKPRIDFSTPNGVTELEAQVQYGLGGQLRDFHIDIRAEGLMLQGCAQTYHAKQQAEQAVQEATGLPILANEIEVS